MKKAIKRISAAAVLTTLLVGGLIGPAQAKNGDHSPRMGHAHARAR